jgi:WD40 repeat protein
MTVRVWSAETGALLRTLTGHTDAVWGVATSPDGRLIVSASADDTLRLWRVSNGSLARVLSDPSGYYSSITFTPDSSGLFSGSFDGHARLWNIGKTANVGSLGPHVAQPVVRTFGHHEGSIRSVAYAPAGDTLASGSADTSARIWDAFGGRELHDLADPLDVVNGVAYSKDGTILAGCAGSPPPDTKDSRIYLWDVATGVLLRTMPGHFGGTTSVDLSLDGTRVGSGGRDSLVKLWNTATGTLVRTLGGLSGGVSDVQFSPDGQTIAASTLSGKIQIWRYSDGVPVRTITSPNGIQSFDYSSDGTTIVTGEEVYGGNVQLWNVETGDLVRTFAGDPNGFMQGVAFTSDDAAVLSGSGYSREIRMWRVSDGALLQVYDHETGWGQDPQLWIEASPDGSSFVYGRTDATLDVALLPF